MQGADVEYPGNVASFQLVIYEGLNEGEEGLEGRMEFRYGNYRPTNPNNKGAVGYKGNTQTTFGLVDFVNALYNGFDAVNFPANIDDQRNSQILNTI